MELLCISLWGINSSHGSTEHKFTCDCSLNNMAQSICSTRETQAVLICLLKKKNNKTKKHAPLMPTQIKKEFKRPLMTQTKGGSSFSNPISESGLRAVAFRRSR